MHAGPISHAGFMHVDVHIRRKSCHRSSRSIPMRSHLRMSFQHLHFSTVHLIAGMLQSSLFCGMTVDRPSPQRGFFIWHMGDNYVQLRSGFAAVTVTFTTLKIYQSGVAEQGSRRWQRILYYINNLCNSWRNQNFRHRTCHSTAAWRTTAAALFGW